MNEDEYISLVQAARETPTQPRPNTLGRWARFGVKVSGKHIRLRSIRVGGRIYTKRQWLTAFLEDVAKADIQLSVVQHQRRVEAGS